VIPLHQDPFFTFRFAEARLIPRFHLEGVPSGRQVQVYWANPETLEPDDLLATAVVGEAGWVELPQPIVVRAGDVFVVVPTDAPKGE
jgi:hypothetical protein